MKKRVVLAAMVSVTLALGLAVIGCDNGSTGGGGGDDGGDLFAGTWEGFVYDNWDTGTTSYLKAIAANNSFKVYETCTYPNLTNIESKRGTYTVSGSTATITITEELWVTYYVVSGNIVSTEWRPTNQSQTVSLTGNSISFLGSTYTKIE
jgi:hypothetical protein